MLFPCLFLTPSPFLLLGVGTRLFLRSSPLLLLFLSSRLLLGLDRS